MRYVLRNYDISESCNTTKRLASNFSYPIIAGNCTILVAPNYSKNTYYFTERK